MGEYVGMLENNQSCMMAALRNCQQPESMLDATAGQVQRRSRQHRTIESGSSPESSDAEDMPELEHVPPAVQQATPLVPVSELRPDQLVPSSKSIALAATKRTQQSTLTAHFGSTRTPAKPARKQPKKRKDFR